MRNMVSSELQELQEHAFEEQVQVNVEVNVPLLLEHVGEVVEREDARVLPASHVHQAMQNMIAHVAATPGVLDGCVTSPTRIPKS